MRVLLAFWDGGEGHLARVAHLARLLDTRGHECLILASQGKVDRVHQLAPAALVTRIENRPMRLGKPGPETPIYSHAFRHAQRRLALGFDDERFVILNVDQIISVIHSFQPNLIVNDYHDTIRIAADAAGVPLVSIAMAHGLSSGDSLGAWKMSELDGRPVPTCLDSFNHARSIFGLRPYQDERETFEGQLNLVPSCPVLDPLEQRPTDIYVGPIMTPPKEHERRERTRRLVVSYLAEGNNRPFTSYPHALAQVVATENSMDFVVLGGARYACCFKTYKGFIGSVRPENYLKLIARADLVITHGGTTLVHALERSVPVLCLPWNSSEAAWAVRADEQGAGMLYPAYWKPLEWKIDPRVHAEFSMAGHWTLKITAETLRCAIYQILHEPGYQRAANELSQQLRLASTGIDLVAVLQGVADRSYGNAAS